jgi:DNA-binding NarL/FixJ family response regulator
MKILIADDHPLFRAGIRHVLHQLSEQVEITEVGDHAQILEQLAAHDFALALLDLNMPGMQGLTTIEILARNYPLLPLVILSASESRADMQRAFDCGALGFIQKSATPAVMLSALKLVLAGGIYLPPALLQSEVAVLRPSSENLADLTPRQSTVLACVLEGRSNKEIAIELGLTESTVKTHITSIYKSLKVTNRMQAMIAVGKLDVSRT